jgi:uncharacterized protein (DUF58 family)
MNTDNLENSHNLQRAGTVFALMVISLLGALISSRERSQDILFNISYLLAFLLLISFVWTWINIRTIRLMRITRARRAQVGRTMEERFVVDNTGFLPKLWLEVRDHSDLPNHLASHVIKAMRGHGRYQWRVNTLCLRRGRYSLGPLTLTSGDPFGLFQRQRQLTATSHMIVYPLTVEIPRFALPVGILPGGDALRRRTHYVTPNASGVRDYAPGDSFNRIHWPSSARRDRLIVKEFELDPLADIWIVPDMEQDIQVADPTFKREEELFRPLHWTRPWEYELDPSTEEYVVTIAASLAEHFLRRNRAVGMLTYAREREIIQADRGERQLNKILETLAIIEGLGDIPIHHVLNTEIDYLPRGTTLIVVTPSADESIATMARQVERRGVRIMVVLVDPASFGASWSAAGIASLLRSSGTPTYLVRRGDPLGQVLSQRSEARSPYFAVA